jgi:hypothetical protein
MIPNYDLSRPNHFWQTRRSAPLILAVAIDRGQRRSPKSLFCNFKIIVLRFSWDAAAENSTLVNPQLTARYLNVNIAV